MSTRVTVSASEVLAARLMLKRAAAFGREVGPAIKAIASARRRSRAERVQPGEQPGPAADPAPG